MKKNTIVILAAIFVLAAGALFASNMGFKLNYKLVAASDVLPEGGNSNSGTNSIALPYNAQTGIINASDLFDDIGSAAVQNIQALSRATDGLTTYASGGTDYALTPGTGYFVRMKVGGTTDYIVVGSHDPSLGIGLTAASDALPEGGTSNSGTNFFSYPYHSTTVNANDLSNDIGSANVQNIQKLNRATDGLETCAPGCATPFTLKPGEAYFVRMKVGSGLTYTPSHY